MKKIQTIRENKDQLQAEREDTKVHIRNMGGENITLKNDLEEMMRTLHSIRDEREKAQCEVENTKQALKKIDEENLSINDLVSKIDNSRTWKGSPSLKN